MSDEPTPGPAPRTTDHGPQTPGPALDALVAELVMGYRHEGRYWCAPDNAVWQEQPPPYSQDIAAAWQVVEQLRRRWPRPLQFTCEDDQSVMVWYARFENWRTRQIWTASDASMPLAICRAALAAVQSEAGHE